MLKCLSISMHIGPRLWPAPFPLPFSRNSLNSMTQMSVNYEVSLFVGTGSRVVCFYHQDRFLQLSLIRAPRPLILHLPWIPPAACLFPATPRKRSSSNTLLDVWWLAQDKSCLDSCCSAISQVFWLDSHLRRVFLWFPLMLQLTVRLTWGDALGLIGKYVTLNTDNRLATTEIGRGIDSLEA